MSAAMTPLVVILGLMIGWLLAEWQRRGGGR